MEALTTSDGAPETTPVQAGRLLALLDSPWGLAAGQPWTDGKNDGDRAALALVVLLAGCGGGSGGQVEPLKGAAYVQRVDAIANGLDSLAGNLTSQIENGSSAHRRPDRGPSGTPEGSSRAGGDQAAARCQGPARTPRRRRQRARGRAHAPDLDGRQRPVRLARLGPEPERHRRRQSRDRRHHQSRLRHPDPAPELTRGVSG